MDRLDISELTNIVSLALGGEFSRGACIGPAGVRTANIGRRARTTQEARRGLK